MVNGRPGTLDSEVSSHALGTATRLLPKEYSWLAESGEAAKYGGSIPRILPIMRPSWSSGQMMTLPPAQSPSRAPFRHSETLDFSPSPIVLK